MDGTSHLILSPDPGGLFCVLSRPMEPPTKKDALSVMRRPDEWKDPWRRSKSPRRRPGPGSPLRGRRRHRPSGSSVSLSNSSRYQLLHSVTASSSLISGSSSHFLVSSLFAVFYQAKRILFDFYCGTS